MPLSNTSATTSLLFVLALAGCAAEADPNEPNPPSGQSGSTPVGTSGTGSGSGGTGSTPVGGSGSVAGTTAAGSSGAPQGTAGTGATPGNCAPIAPEDMLSDFEMGKAQLNEVAMRKGSWFLYADTSAGTQLPTKIVNTPLAAETGGACGSTFGFHTSAMGYTTWGAGWGTDFSSKLVYSLADYTAIGMRAKAATSTLVRLSISDFNTVPEGMMCTDTTVSTDKTRCGDYFGADFTIPAGAEYQDIVVNFADFRQRGFGAPSTSGFDKTRTYAVRMQVKGSVAQPTNYDVWIDDVHFVR